MQQPGLSSEQWRKALDVATGLKATVEGLRLPPDQEWLRYVLGEAADAMRASVLWAATAGAAPAALDTAQLRQYAVAADATRGDALVASYFVAFAHSQGVIDDEAAQRIGNELAGVEAAMDAISRELTAHLGFDPYQAASKP
jgi:hypothetical protein